jgi:ferritin-like metal-binding protein YciE
VATIENAHELFAHQLRTMLWVELTLDDEVLPELFELVHAVDLKWNVEHHMHETRGHVRNIRRVLALVGEPDDPQETPALLALKQEHASLLKSVPEDRDDLRDLVHADAIMRTEHYEVAAYNGLVHLAKALGLDLDAVTLLRQNMGQDAHALEQVEHATAKLLAEKVESRV